MNSIRMISFACLTLAGTLAAEAQDRCTAYANEMVAIDQRARQMKCPAWKSHSNWNGHYDWCGKQPPVRVKDALDTWSAKLDGCAFTFGGQGGGYQPPRPKAAADGSRRPICSSFAAHAVKWRNGAAAKGCDVYRLNEPLVAKSEGELVDWCMNTSDAEFRTRSPQALGFKGVVEKQCGQQLRRPFRL